MWFCSSGFGPGPLVTPTAPLANGSAGPRLIMAKNAVITNITMSAHPTNGSSVFFRNRQATAAVKPASTSAHSKIEPSSADHIAAKL